MKNIIKHILLLACTSPLWVSCSDWLDVQPQSQVKDNELYSSEAGFKEALAGVYGLIVTQPLFVKEMRFGLLGVLAQEWSGYSTASSAYPSNINYDYTTTNMEGKISAIWEGLYTAITNANVILEVIDSKKSVFSELNYEVIKGETHALRAFIHFELLRCFGASWIVDPNKPSIPYVTKYEPKQSKQLTVSQVIDKVLEDLETAAGLLKNIDPIHTGREITEIDDNGYLMNRQLHLNYYAVKGLMARVYLHKHDYANAELCAREVIESEKFEWVSQQNMINVVDPAGVSEHLWGIDVNNLSTIASNNFAQTSSSPSFSLDKDRLDLYYDDERISSDYRWMYLFTEGEGQNYGDYRYLRKFNTSSNSSSYYRNKMTMIKLSEMYYIIAECRQATGGNYLDPMNEVRIARGLQPIDNEPVNFLNYLTAEFRKDFLGEGQLFFLYKRYNMEKIYGTENNLVDLKAYVFPLPVSEREAADREDNR